MFVLDTNTRGGQGDTWGYKDPAQSAIHKMFCIQNKLSPLPYIRAGAWAGVAGGRRTIRLEENDKARRKRFELGLYLLGIVGVW